MVMPTNRRILSASSVAHAAYLAYTMQLRMRYGNVKLAPSCDIRTSRLFAPKWERSRRLKLGAKDFCLHMVLDESNGIVVKFYLWCIA